MGEESTAGRHARESAGAPVPRRQLVEPAHHGCPGRPALGSVHRQHRRARPPHLAPRFRGARALRHPVHDRAAGHRARHRALRRVRRRERPGPLPHSHERAHRGGPRPPCDRGGAGHLSALRALSRAALAQRLARGRRGRVRPAQRHAAPPRVDLVRPGRPPHFARPRAAQRGIRGGHSPRAARHLRPHPRRVDRARQPPRRRRRPRLAPHGIAPSHEGLLRPLGLHGADAHDSRSPQALRAHRGRHGHQLVHLRRARRGLGRRRPRPAHARVG